MDETSANLNTYSIELEQGSAGAAAYESLNRRNVAPQEAYECLKPERKIIESSKLDKIADRTFLLILLSTVVIALVVAFIVVAVIVNAVVRETAADGAWTLWGEWGFCSVTCGGGLRTRNRTCTNPPPNLTGRYCDGNSEQIDICNNVPCEEKVSNATDGAWTLWGEWGFCSVTCGGGLRTRNRTCTNPPPNPTGRYCDGNSEHMEICNNVPCEEKVSNDSAVAKEILFSARGIKNLSPVAGETLVFETTIINKGGKYNNTTGIFTVPVSGVFIFSVQLCVGNKKLIYYEIATDSRALLKGLSIDDYGSTYGCYASSVPAYVTAGERVWVKTGRPKGSNTLKEDASENWNMFSGVLVQTENK